MKAYRRASSALGRGGYVIRIRHDGTNLWIVDVDLDASIEIVEPNGTMKSWISVGKLRELGNGNAAKRREE